MFQGVVFHACSELPWWGAPSLPHSRWALEPWPEPPACPACFLLGAEPAPVHPLGPRLRLGAVPPAKGPWPMSEQCGNFLCRESAGENGAARGLGPWAGERGYCRGCRTGCGSGKPPCWLCGLCDASRSPMAVSRAFHLGRALAGRRDFPSRPGRCPLGRKRSRWQPSGCRGLGPADPLPFPLQTAAVPRSGPESPKSVEHRSC